MKIFGEAVKNKKINAKKIPKIIFCFFVSLFDYVL